MLLLFDPLKFSFPKQFAAFLHKRHFFFQWIKFMKLFCNLSVKRYFNFKPSFKLQWCLTRDLFLITNSSDHRRVWTANFLDTKSLPNTLGHRTKDLQFYYVWCFVCFYDEKILALLFKITQRFLFLLYAFLSMSPFVFENFGLLKHNDFMKEL